MRQTTAGDLTHRNDAMGATEANSGFSVFPVAIFRVGCILAAAFMQLSCRRPTAQPATAQSAVEPTVASLVPAATDILVQIGAANHLVGISNYDSPDLLGLTGLPRVGDYQTIDWERLEKLRPDILIVFESKERLPAGLRQRASAMHMQLVNVRTETIGDIVHEAMRLGGLVNEKQKAAKRVAEFQHRLDVLRKANSNRRPVPTLLIRDVGGIGVVGTNNFLNEALNLAGGENVIQAAGWPDIDREMLAALKPQAIIILLAEQTPQARAGAKAFFELHKDLPAVKNKRAYIIDRWYCQQSSMSVADVAEQMSRDLHPAGANIEPAANAEMRAQDSVGSTSRPAGDRRQP